MIRAQWEWVLEDASGRPAAGAVSPAFTTQFDAEQWLGEHWRRLAASGVASARLLHEGTQATPGVELRVS